jgi:hypothetical protein
MRNMCLGITAMVITAGMVSVGAQGRNFSGTWVIDSEKTMAAAQATIGGTGGAVVARSGGGGGRGSATGGVLSGGGGVAVGAGVARSGGRGGAVMTAAGADTVITIDAATFSIDSGGFQTNYPLTGTEATIQTRSGEAKARASWKGDTLVIEQTSETPNGPVTVTTSWFLEGDSLVRLNTRRTYYKRK